MRKRSNAMTEKLQKEIDELNSLVQELTLEIFKIKEDAEANLTVRTDQATYEYWMKCVERCSDLENFERWLRSNWKHGDTESVAWGDVWQEFPSQFNC